MTGYRSLAQTIKDVLDKITSENYENDRRLINASYDTIDQFIKEVEAQDKKASDTKLFNRIQYNDKIVLGENPNNSIANWVKPNLKEHHENQVGYGYIVPDTSTSQLTFPAPAVVFRAKRHGNHKCSINYVYVVAYNL